MKRGYLTVAIAAAVIGIIASYISLNNYLRIRQDVAVAEKSFCSISEFIDCDVVESSSYADIKGLPLAGIGLIYYTLILCFAFYARFSRGFKRRTVAFCWWLTIPAALYSIALAYVSLSILKVLCLTCVTMYVVNFCLFITLFLTLGLPREEWAAFLWGYWLTILKREKRGINFMPKFWMHLAVCLIIFGVGLLILTNVVRPLHFSRLGGFDGEESITAEKIVSDYLDRYSKQSKYDIKFNKKDTPMWGTDGAPVTIVEFSDYLCPFCKRTAFLIKPFIAEYKKDVAYYFINYPLDQECNHYMQYQMHSGACLAAKGGICANEQGKFWPYHDRVFMNKSEAITRDEIVNIAGKIRLDVKKFNECLDAPSTERKIKEDIETARRIYLTGTPSIFLNDRQIPLVLNDKNPFFKMNPYILRAIIESELKASR